MRARLVELVILCETVVPGDPIPKGRPRTGKGGRTYTPKRTEEAEEAVAWALVEGRKVRKPTTELVAVTLEFRCATQRRCDVDNMAKLVLDAGNGVVWVDDQQVARLVCDVYRGHPEPGTTVLVEVLSRATLTR